MGLWAAERRKNYRQTHPEMPPKTTITENMSKNSDICFLWWLVRWAFPTERSVFDAHLVASNGKPRAT